MGRYQLHVEPKQRDRLRGTEEYGTVRVADHRYATDRPMRADGFEAEAEVFRP